MIETSPHPLLPAAVANASASPETGRLLAETDWSATSLGAPETWPQSLRIAVSLCLGSRFPMFVWWGPDLINIYNDAYAPVLGKRHPRAFGARARETWHDIWDVVGPQQQAVMERGEATWNERVLLVMERNGFTEDTWFTWSYSPIYRGDGSVGGLFCACTEETARVHAERERDRLMAQALDAARMLQNWFDNAPGFIALLRGPEHVFELVNRAYYQLVGHRTIVGKPAFEALPELRSQGFENLLAEVLATGKPFIGRAVPVRIQQSPGAPLVERFLDLVYQPVFDNTGQAVGVFVQGHDVTEQVQATEALREADQRKDEFLATLAHELRNPLAPMRQATAIARRADTEPQRRDWALQVIERQLSHMSLLMDDLLDISRISRGQLELRLEHVDLRDVVSSALESAAPDIEARHHELQLHLPPEPVIVHADPVRLAQVVINLLSNAAKYTAPGGCIVLTVAVEGQDAALRVRDNGIGLAPEDRERVFGMFSQVRSALDRAEGGLGIGLAITRGIVQLHGGRVEATSEGAGRGTEFVVHLPLEAAQAPASASEQVTAAAPQPGAGRRILVADDNLDALETLSLLLEAHGHEVHGARDGEQALEQLIRLRPEVAILDIGMPRLNGYEVAQRYRAQEQGSRTLLIALTGWGQQQDQARAQEAGFDRHCTKPVEIDRLLRLIEEAR